jgi:glycerol kinase
MRADLPPDAGAETVLRVDGGMAASDWAMQRLADILDAPVDRPAIKETTAVGAAYLAGLRAGLYPPLADFAARWRCERAFRPALAAETRAAMVAGWRDAVKRTLSGRKA